MISAVLYTSVKLYTNCCHHLQALTGLHLRAGGVIFILTLFSLFVGWGSYMNIGFEHDNYRRSVKWEYVSLYIIMVASIARHVVIRESFVCSILA